MTTNKEIEPLVIERTFDAPVALVWRALTQVEDMRRWYFDLKEFKAEVGFEFQFVVEHNGLTYHHLCKVVEVIPQKKIVYTWRYLYFNAMVLQPIVHGTVSAILRYYLYLNKI